MTKEEEIVAAMALTLSKIGMTYKEYDTMRFLIQLEPKMALKVANQLYKEIKPFIEETMSLRKDCNDSNDKNRKNDKGSKDETGSTGPGED